MPSDTRATLRQLILDHGRTLATDPRRCEAMLRDLCADQRREVNLLINALREQIAADLLTSRSAEPQGMRLARLSRRLEDHLSLKPEAAGWAVETWALVLGVIEHPQPAAPTPSAPVPAVPDIHGWGAAQVQRLQQSTAEALSLPVAFRDRLAQGGIGPELMVIPAGSFLMGSPKGEEGRDECEGPQHRVTIVRPFAIGRFAATFEEYDAFCAATKREKPGDKGWGRGRQPVVNVSWDDAVAYCQWLSAQTGQAYRLPSEAEWEYACRAGTTTPFHFGAALSTAQANYDGNRTYGPGARGKYRQRSVAVGHLPANPWGLYEVHGNVREWCKDCWNDSYAGAPTDGGPWLHGDCRRRVLRGGSWVSFPRFARAASRDFNYSPEDRYLCDGFRLARTLDHSLPLAPKPTPNAPPPGAPDIHGWGAAQVQRLQRSAAETLSLPVAFRDRLTQGGVGPELIVIPAGRFLMGSPEGEAGREDREGPQHRVTFARPFAIGRFAVTFEEYDAFCAATKREKPGDEGWGRGRQPVINVSWDDAVAYCQWLSGQTRQEYRLPTEADWEYACRAGTSTPFHFGETITTAQGNYYGNVNHGRGVKGENRQRTVAVGSLPANPWGLYEVHGNVWEWCEDCWNRGYVGAPMDASAWRNGDCQRRVLRGGSWNDSPWGARAAFRLYNSPQGRSRDVGFRLAKTL